MSTTLGVQLLVNGIMVGSLLALIALGVALIFGVAGVVNFAHGEFVTLGAFATYLLVTRLGVPPLWGVPVSFVLAGLVGLVVQRLILLRMTGRPQLDVLMATYALSILGLGLFSAIFGGDFRNYSDGPTGVIALSGVVIGWRSLTVLLASVVLGGAAVVILQRARFGLGLRALAQNRDSAAALGVNVVKAEGIAFALAVGLAGAAGALVSLNGTVTPSVGHALVLDAFVVVVLGGMGSITGSIIASMFIGCLQSFGSFLLDDTWARIITFGLLYLALLLRPRGLLGRAGA